MNNSYPLVSIAMTTYNGANYLVEQLDSLLAQTYQNIEIIIVDDGSSDDTIDIIKNYQARHANIFLFLNESNLGYIKNFEKAITLCNGDYIALCDQDDIWDKEKITEQMQHIDKGDLIYCDSELIDASGRFLNKRHSDLRNLISFYNPIPIFCFNCTPGHTMLMKRDFALRTVPFPQNLIHDWWLAFQAAIRNGAYYLDKPLVKYRQHCTNQIGAIRTNKKQKCKENVHDITARKRARINYFYHFNESIQDETARTLLSELKQSYENFSFVNNYKRMLLFAKYPELLAIKKSHWLKKFFFPIKLFVKIF